MKTFFRALFLSLLISFDVKSQALIYINNFPVSQLRISTNSVMGGPATGFTAPINNLYNYAVFYSTNAATVHGETSAVILDSIGSGPFGFFAFDDSNWTLAAYATNAVVGLIRSTTAEFSGLTAIPGLAVGESARFTVLGWSSAMGNTLSDVENFLSSPQSSYAIGESGVSGLITMGDLESIVPSRLFSPIAPGILGFTIGTVDVVPEPKTNEILLLSLPLMLLLGKHNFSYLKSSQSKDPS